MDKMIKLKSLGLLLGIVSILIGLSNCSKIENGLSQLQWQIDFDLVNTSWDIQFKDAATGEFIGLHDDTRVEVNITGPDQAHVLDMAGIRHDLFFSTKGFLGLVLHPDRGNPGENDPVKITVHAKVDGFLPVQVPIETFHIGIQPIEIMLVNLNAPPEGVKVFHEENISNVVYGKLEDSLLLYTPGNRLELLIPKDTELRDKNDLLLGGPLTITLALWDCTKESAMQALSGGPLALLNVTQFELGIKQPASQVFIRIQDQYGKIASQLSKSMEATFLVDPEIFHPEIGRFVRPDDVLPVYVLDGLTGVWSRENTVVLEAFQNKVLARITLNESGMFHFGWMDQSYCSNPLPLIFSSLPEYSLLPYSFRLKVYRNYNNQFQYLFSFCIAGQTNGNSELRYLPVGKELILRFEPYINCSDPYYRSPDPVLLTGECSINEPLENHLLPLPPGEVRELDVVFIDTQHNNTEYTPASFAGYYRKIGDSCWNSAMVYKGTSYLYKVNPGEQYEMGINFKGQFHRKEIVISESGILHVKIEID